MAKRAHVTAIVVLCALLGVRAGAASSPVTLYFHSDTQASDVDEATATAGAGAGPQLVEAAPTGSNPKAATAVVAGAQGFRKNVLGAWWAASFSGEIGSPSVHFWAFSTAAIALDVSLFKNGPAGRTPPIAVQSVRAVDGLSEYEVLFPGTSAQVAEGIVVQIFAHTLEDQGSNIVVLFDSTDFPSSVSFTLS